MSDINYSEVLFQSIDQIVEERLKQVQYDRTIVCEIIEAYPDENRYWVNCEGLKLEVSSIDPKKTYSINSMVYVLVPNGNYENTKVIIGGYSTKDIEKKTYNNSYDNFISNQTIQVIDESNQMTLSVKDSDVLETDAILYSPIQYNREYDYVGVHWSMQTYTLFDANITSGQYTLEIVFFNDDDAIISYQIHSSSIYGNPYSLSEDFEQYTLFPYSDKLNTCTHFKIRLYQGIKDEKNPENRIDKFNYTGTDNPQIILCSLDLSVGYTNTDFKEEQSLNIGKDESLNYKLNDSNNLERTLYFDWRVIDKNKNNQIFNYNNTNFKDFINNTHIYWLQYQENIGYDSFKENTSFNKIGLNYTSIEGLYNWKIILDSDNISNDKNIFKLPITIDTDYQTDQYKIFIVYEGWVDKTDEQNNTIQNLQTLYDFTNTIIFENLDIAPIQVGDANSDKPNSLKLTLNDGNTGIYNVYGLDGRVVDSSKQGPYTITASLFDSLQDKIEKVEWFFPSLNTMIIDARDTNWENLPEYDSENHNDKLTVKYKIKTQYYASATFNTIQCRITMTTGEIRNASISFEFGEVGNQGTNYAFNIDFIDKDYLTYGEVEEELQVKATLSNQNGEEVLIEDFINNLEWSWLFDESGETISNKEDNPITEITSLSNIICSKYEENNIVKLRLGNDFNFSNANYSILQAKLVGYNTDSTQTDLVTYLCVPVAAADDEDIKPRSMQGASRIVYDSLGVATTYSKEPYEVINENGTQIENLKWELFTVLDETTKIPKYSGIPSLEESKVKKQDKEKDYITKYKIKPSSYVPPKIPPVSIMATKGEEKEKKVYWSQPILITQNIWFNDSVNEWNGVLEINEGEGKKGGSILSPLLIAGTKTTKNLFTGVTIGQLAIGSKTVNGVYGFNEGKTRFWLNENAEFYIGTGKDHYITFNENDGLDIIAKSFDFRTPETITNKLVLSSIEQKFYMGNDNGYISFEKEDASDYRTLKINAKNFELTTDNIILSSSGHYLLIRKSTNENSDRVRAGYIRTEEKNNKIYGLDIYGGALRVYTKESSINPALWVQDSKIYLKGRITNEYKTTPSTWMTMGYPDTSEGSDGGSGFRIFNTDIYSSTIPIFKIWPGYTEEKYNAIVISGYNKIKLCPYVTPNNKDTNSYSSYLEVNTSGGAISEKWVLYNTQRFVGEIRTPNSLAICRTESNYNTYNLHLWSDDSYNGIVDASSGKLSLRSKNSTFIEGTTSGGALYGAWTYGTLSGSNITSNGEITTTASLSIIRKNAAATYDLHLWSDNSNYSVIDAANGNLSLRSKNNSKLEINSSGGNLYGTWSAFHYGTVNGETSNWYSFKTHLNGGRLYGTWYEGNSSTAITSDRNLKNSITFLEERYEILFDNLIPIKYKYNQGTSSRFHTGFIAQDVEIAITLANLTTQDFAGLVFDVEDQSYYLRYDEFIALNTWQIQKLKTRVTELENEIKEIKQRYEI